MSDHNTVDVLVVGGGPSGLAAALCLSRACYKTVIFDSGSYRNEQAHHMHMFPTWDHQDPKAYRASARKELQERYDTVRFVDLAVTAVIRDKDGSGGFKAVDSSGEDWYGKKLVLASGVKDIFPDIPGYDECWVKGIFHCLFCHGYEDRGVDSVGVLAIDVLAAMPPATDGLIRNALQFTNDVTVYTNNGSEAVVNSIQPLVAKKKNVKFDNRTIKRLRKESKAAEVSIEFEDGSRITHGFIVHAPKIEMKLDYAKELNLEKSPTGMELKVSQPWQETTEPGCFAVGDVGTMGKLVIAGVAFGMFAGTGIIKQLQAD